MASDQELCPGCAHSLVMARTGKVRRYQCEQCHSAVIGIAVLRTLLAEGEAQRLWQAARSVGGPSVGSADSVQCPFCSWEMVGAPAPAGRIAVCPRCEMVWLTHDALNALPAAAAPTPLGVPAIPRCHNCGAPLTDSFDGSCHYCGQAVVAPQIVMVEGAHVASSWGTAGSWVSAAAVVTGSLLELLIGNS